MKLERLFVVLACCVLSAFVLAGCAPSDTNVDIPTGDGGEEDLLDVADEGGDNELADLEGTIKIDGSSTVGPISTAVAETFRKDFPNIKVSVEISGTGGGFKRFTKGETDISDASRPIKQGEFENCKSEEVEFIEVPVAYDGLSIVVNPKNDFVESMTVEQLKKIFLEKDHAKTWKDVNDAWPETEISVYAPGTESGTYDYFFGDVVNKDEQGTPRKEMSLSEDDNVLVKGVAGDEGAIGFFGAAYYFENKDELKIVKIINPKTEEAVEPTLETIASGEYAPFSRPLFIYLNRESLDRPEMQEFVKFYLRNASELSEKVGYVSLPEDLYELARNHVLDRLCGTHYLTEEGEKRSGGLEAVYVTDNLVNSK